MHAYIVPHDLNLKRIYIFFPSSMVTISWLLLSYKIAWIVKFYIQTLVNLSAFVCIDDVYNLMSLE